MGPRPQWGPYLIVAGVALAASIVGIRNDWALDDIPLIVWNPAAHSFSEIVTIFSSSYWPEPFYRDLYRPFASLFLTLQWVLARGSPLMFRVVSYSLYVLVSLSVLNLARHLLPERVALAVAVLFAAHPVHVEAVALAVNQGEQWVALAALLATTRYLDIRRRGWPSGGDWVQLAALYLTGCLFKESGLVIPGFLLAAELTLQDGTSIRERARKLGPGLGALAVIGLAFLVLRAAVLQNLVGTVRAAALVDQGLGGRLLTMLRVVPEWVRLLVWPALLRGDYSPAVIEPAVQWGVLQSLGAMLLIALGALAWLSRVRAPVFSFGILWTAIALFPVSNVIVPTGVLMSERSLLLPSVGFLLAGGAILASWERAAERPVGGLLKAAVLVLVVAGVARSGLRQRDWRNHRVFWGQTLLQAPLSHKAYHAFGQILRAEGHVEAADLAFQMALVLYPNAYWISHELGDEYKKRGLCAAAVPLYAESLRIEPDQPAARLSRITCLGELGRDEEAQAEVDRGMAIIRARERDELRSR